MVDIEVKKSAVFHGVHGRYQEQQMSHKDRNGTGRDGPLGVGLYCGRHGNVSRCKGDPNW